jgi:hypothetical protein
MFCAPEWDSYLQMPEPSGLIVSAADAWSVASYKYLLDGGKINISHAFREITNTQVMFLGKWMVESPKCRSKPQA